MSIATAVRSIDTGKRSSPRSFLSQVFLLTRRNLMTIARTPEALLPPIGISIFFLIVYLVIVALIDSGDHLIVQPDTALVLRPQGDIVEQYSGTPLDHVIMQATESGRQETRLRDLVERRATEPVLREHLQRGVEDLRRLGIDGGGVVQVDDRLG